MSDLTKGEIMRGIFLLICVLVVGCSTTPERPLDKTNQQGSLAVSEQETKEEGVSSEAKEKFKLALNNIKSKNYANAKKLLIELTEDYPDLSGPHVNLALVSMHEGDIPSAERFVDTAIKVNANNYEAYRVKAILSKRQGRFPEAADYYVKAIELNPSDAVSHLNLGVVYDLYLGKLNEALNHYKTYQKLKPDSADKVKIWIADLEGRLSQ